MISKGKWFALAVAILLMSACGPAVIRPPSTGVSEPPPASRAPERVEDEMRRRNEVAAALTEQGRRHLDEGRVDSAIRVFEQALGQSPHFGPAYYYLAECWLRKNNETQANAFHGQADLYLPEQALWRDRLQRQKETIARRFSALSSP